MPIISISLNEKILNEMDALQASLGFSGRSEIIRAGIRSFMQEEKQHKEFDNGVQSAVLLITHLDEFDDRVTKIKHTCEDLIQTHLHNKIDGHRCIEMFLLNGEFDKINNITQRFQNDKNMDVVKLVIF